MKVFALVNGADTAGTHWRLARAFQEHAPDWEFRAMCASSNYIRYPVDVPWDVGRLMELYDGADVIHISHFMFGHDNYDAGQGKPTVLMHHGTAAGTKVETPFHDRVAIARDAGMTQVGSTYDLVILEPELQWAPTAYDLEWLRGIRKQHYRDGSLRLVHAPTNREIKGTALLLEAVESLRADGHRIELVMTEGRPWVESLAAIATADLAFDQPILGIGCFAVECMGMGVPVIAGVVDERVREGMAEHWGGLPFRHVDPTAASIRAAILELLDPAARDFYRDRGTRHVERFHDASRVVERMKGIYSGAGPSQPGGSAKRATRPTDRAQWRRGFNARQERTRRERAAVR